MDNHVLYGPGGASAVNIGSWLRADPGPDYDPGAVLQAEYAENPFFDGGYLAFENNAVRKMRFPLIIASGGAGLSLVVLEELLRFNARPGAYLDIQPDGVPSAEAVRFDVLTGRWKPDYNIRHNEIDRRLGTLELDVQPFGYWPTWITLASSASVGIPGFMDLPAGSRVGDVPGFARIFYRPTMATQFRTDGGASAWMIDMMAWGFAHSSFNPLFAGGSWANWNLPATLGAPASQAPDGKALIAYNSAAWAAPTWGKAGFYDMASALASAYVGRFRMYSLQVNTPSLVVYNRSILSAHRGQLPYTWMPSGNPIATTPHSAAYPSAVTPPLGAMFGLLDHGEMMLNNPSAGVGQTTRVLLWTGYPTTNVGVSTTAIYIGGAIAIPADMGGVLHSGLAMPSIKTDPNVIFPANAEPGHLMIDGLTRKVLLNSNANQYGPASFLEGGDGMPYYRGKFPMIGATVGRIAFTAGARTASSGYAAATGNQLIQPPPPAQAAAIVQYRPRFAFLGSL